MTDYNSYPTLLQSSQAEYVSSETMDVNSNQMSNNSNNNIIYNSAPLIVLNSQKQDMALLQNSMMNDGQTYLTIQTQPSAGSGTDLNGAKLLNTPIIIQNSQSMPLQASQYQQQSPSTINVQQNATNQMTSLTPSQLQSLSYLMQTQMAPQFIQTSNGLIQIIPQGFITTQQQPNQGQSHDHSLQAQMAGLPTISWSLGNFNGSNNPITLDNQLQSLQVNNLSLPQLIPVQHVIQSNNSFFTNQNDNQDQMVSSIVDLNVNDKKSSLNSNKKTSRRKRKATNKIAADCSQLSSPLAHPTSTNDVTREVAESSSGGGRINCINGDSMVTQYDNKGRPFSFFCPDCPKKFTLNSRLSAHMRCHTGMRPFTCTVCGFSFTQKSYLIRHAAVHKEERPFHCEKCQKSYKHYGSLANHRKLHRKDDRTDNDLMNDDCMKLEPTASENGRSSSISSLVINNNNNGNCAEFVIGQSYENGGMMICQEEEEECEDDGDECEEEEEGEEDEEGEKCRVSESVNNFAISSTTTTNMEHNLNNSYMLYPMTLSQMSDSTDNTINKSTNIFFQEQPQAEDMEENYGEEEEEDGDGEGHEVDNGCRDTHMLDLNLVSSGTCLVPSQYHL